MEPRRGRTHDGVHGERCHQQKLEGSGMTKNQQLLGDEHAFVRLVDSMPENVPGAGDQRIVDAARNSVAGLDVRPTSDNEKLIAYLVKNKHSTPLEFVRFTFHVRLPLFVARQWVRHRAGAFNEESARYGKLRDDFYVPTFERVMAGGQSTSNKQGSGVALSKEIAAEVIDRIERHNADSYMRYEAMLKCGLAKELARLVLPVNIYTQWYWSTDLHNLMHFLQLRLHEHAQWEVRQYAKAIEPIAETIAPFAMAAWRKYRLAPV
jgi:thymidylate synthase (FAD)